MSKTIIFLIFVTFFVSKAYSQEIFVSKNRNKADYIVFETDEVSQANWVIMKTIWRNQAKEGIWYFTEWQNDADVIVYFTDNRNEADKILCYTEWTSNIKFDEVKE